MMLSSQNPLRFVKAENDSRDAHPSVAIDSHSAVPGSHLVEPQDQEI